MAKLIQIVSSLPPHVDGVGDFSLALAGELRTFDIETTFVADPDHRNEASVSGFSVTAPNSRSGPALAETLRALSRGTDTAVLVHYSGYGFDPHGAPRWLLDGLKAHVAAQRSSVFCYFHELFTTTPPWRRAFWYSGRQRRVARELCLISRGMTTSTHLYGRILATWRGRAEDIHIIPVFSNVGCPAIRTPFSRRLRRMVVFGKEGSKAGVYRRWNEFARAARTLGIQEVIDIGPRVALPRSDEFRLESTGPLPADQVRAIMSESLAGAICYPPRFLAKSGVFAAYAANGVIPIVSAESYESDDELHSECEYLPVTSRVRSDSAQLEQISENVRAWYDRHTPGEHARITAGLIEKALGLSAVARA